MGQSNVDCANNYFLDTLIADVKKWVDSVGADFPPDFCWLLVKMRNQWCLLYGKVVFCSWILTLSNVNVYFVSVVISVELNTIYYFQSDPPPNTLCVCVCVYEYTLYFINMDFIFLLDIYLQFWLIYFFFFFKFRLLI